MLRSGAKRYGGAKQYGAGLFGSLLIVGVLIFGDFLPTLAKASPDLPVSSYSSQTVSEGSGSPPKKKYEVTIRRPSGTLRLDLGIVDSSGRPVTAACSTCHSNRPTNFENRTPADLDEFHQNLGFAHGTVTCLSCHNPDDYDTLRLADGQTVEYPDVMTLCAQCHGPQTRDYHHGAHGGMNGHWDLSRGPQVRNNCIDCHDPHSPRFPSMHPTFKPRDRFLDSGTHTEKGQHE